MEDAFWTISAMVNYGMTTIPMEIRFETLMGLFFDENPSANETRYRLWVTSFNQPALLFSSVVSSLQENIRTYGSMFPTLLKSLINESKHGGAQIDLVNEGPKFGSLVIRRIGPDGGNPRRALPWFGCRLEIADDARVREHLTTMVLSLRRERDEEKRKRQELESELSCYKSNKHTSEDDDNDRFQALLNTIATAPRSQSPNHLLSDPPSNDKSDNAEEDADIPSDFDKEPAIRVITPLMQAMSQPSTSRSTPISSRTIKPKPSSAQILRGVATYVLCALCPEGNQTVEPDESAVIDHIVNQHFDGESKTCHGCPTMPEVRDVPSHMKMHMSKLYECKYCGKQGTKRNVLQAHLRTHTGEKPYECSYCSRRFADASTLRRHRTTHTGEMRAACPICGRVISRRDNVKAHLRNNHGIEWNPNTALTTKDLDELRTMATNGAPIPGDLNQDADDLTEHPDNTSTIEESEFEIKPPIESMFSNGN